MKKWELFKRKTVTVIVGAVLLAGAGVGAATATSPQADGSPAPSFATSSNNAGFQTNQAGQTYGFPREVNGQAVEPDLIQAVATNGQLGYVDNDELKKAEGHPSMFKSPEEALAWQKSQGTASVTIPVYDSDGATKLGEFVIARGER